jgi:hypothetical protein
MYNKYNSYTEFIPSLEGVDSMGKRQSAFALALAWLWLMNLWLYLATIPLLKPGPDYLGLALDYALEEGPMILFQEEGSGPYIRYMPLALLALLALYALQRLVLDEMGILILWTNWAWIALTIIATLWAALVAAAAQHYNWYYNPAAGIAGEGDDVTHFFSAFALASFLANIDFFDLFGLRGRLGRLAEAALVASLTSLAALWFEWHEALNPSRYWSEFWDCHKDLAMALLAIFAAIALYNFIVEFEE